MDSGKTKKIAYLYLTQTKMFNEKQAEQDSE